MELYAPHIACVLITHLHTAGLHRRRVSELICLPIVSFLAHLLASTPVSSPLPSLASLLCVWQACSPALFLLASTTDSLCHFSRSFTPALPHLQV